MLDTVAGWSMLLLISLLPVFFIPVTWIAVAQAKVVLIAVLLFIAALSWVIARLIEGSVRVPASPILVAGLLIPLAYACSVAFSGVAQVSLVGSGIEQDTLAFVCILYAVLALAALIFSGMPHAGRKIIRGLFLGTFLLVCLKIAYFVVPTLSLGGVVASPTGNAFGNWHEFAIMLGFMLVLGLALRNTDAASGRWRYFLYGVCAIAAGFLVITNFFDVLAAVCIASVVALGIELLVLRARSGHSALSWWHHGVWAAVIFLTLFSMAFGTFIHNVLPPRIQVANVEVRPSWTGTMQIGGLALTQPMSLIFGAGPNTFKREWGLYKPAGVNQTAFWNTEFSSGIGSIPTSFVTTGILGVLAWIIFAATLLWMVVRALLKSGRGAPDTLYVVGFGLASAYLLAFYVLYVPGPALSILTFIAAGLFVAFSVSARMAQPFYFTLRGEGWQSFVRATGLLVFGVVVVAASLGVVRVLASEIILNRSIVVYNETKDIQAASRLIEDALRIHASSARAHRTAVQLGLIQLRELSAKSDPKDEAAKAQLQSTLQSTIQHGLDAVAINDGDYQNWLELAGLYQQLAGVSVAGAYDNARAAYERARAQNPSSPVPLFQLAQLELLEKRGDAALQSLATAVQLKPDFAAAYYLASQIYVSNNDLNNALSAAALAARHAPADPLAWYNAGAIAYTAKDYANAIVALEKALSLEPNHANAAYVLGLAYYQAGRTEDSLKAFETLNTLQPNQAVVQTALTNLRAGQSPVPVTASTTTPATAPAR